MLTLGGCTDDLKQNKAQILLKIVTTDEQKQDLRQKMLKIVTACHGDVRQSADNH